MVLAEPLSERVSTMSDATEPGTKSVRIDKDAAAKLQTIAALKEQMGEKFKPVQYLNGLVVEPIDRLFEETMQAFNTFQARAKRGRKA